jgi:hypothetical protein
MNWSWVQDRLWPTVATFSQEQAQAEEITRRALYDPNLFDQAVHHSGETIDDAVNQCRWLLDQERQRGQSVQDRLTNIVGLSAIAVTVTFGSLLGWVHGNQDEAVAFPRYAKVVTILLTLYILAQLICAILAAIRGLERRSYLEPIPTDLLPNRDDTSFSVKRRRAHVYLECIVDHYNNNSEKLNELGVVHEALRNFLGGVVLLASILTILTLIQRSPTKSTIVEQIRSNPDLIELLRGPRGPQGPGGPPGPTGPIGPPGPSSSSVPRQQSSSSGPTGALGQANEN